MWRIVIAAARREHLDAGGAEGDNGRYAEVMTPGSADDKLDPNGFSSFF